jgi:thiol-disulfide isomerase/thioredoxin
MTSRLLAMFGLATLMMVGLAPAQDKPSTKEKVSIKAQVREAQEAANEDIPKAISILETALLTAPDDRNALFLLGAMSVVQGEKTEDKDGRIELFNKSTNAFAKIQKLYKEITPNEKKFLTRSRIGEARALASEGKNDQALGAIKQAIDGGYDDLEALKAQKDLEPICKLPEFKTLVQALYKAQLEAASKEAAEEMSSFRSFPFDFELKDTDDKTVTLADYKGKVTIVDVWGTWCGPCRGEIPHFVDLHKELKDKGLEIVGINCGEQGTRDQIKKTIKEYAKETRISYTCVLNDDKTEEKIPGFQGYPTTLFLDRSGKVRMMVVGNPGKAKLQAIVTALLADPSKPDGAKVEARTR